jgi:MFS family permease
MLTGSVLIMAGAAVLTAAQNDSYLLGGRFVLGFGVSIGTSSAPTYALELAPPREYSRPVSSFSAHGYETMILTADQSGEQGSLGTTTPVRGTLPSLSPKLHLPAPTYPRRSGAHTRIADPRLVFYTGSILSTGVAYASAKSSGVLAFRLPLALQLIPPLFIFTGALLIPESPRWLTARGKREEAAKILAKYHGGGDVNHPVVQLELREFDEGIEVRKAQSWWNYYDL